MNIADKITLKNFLNTYFLTNNFEIIQKDNKQFIQHYVDNNTILEIELVYHSTTGRNLYRFPVYIITSNNQYSITTKEIINLLLDKLFNSNPKLLKGREKFISQLNNSHINLSAIFNKLTGSDIDKLFTHTASFDMTESAILGGHQMHPTPKSCIGFNQEQFIQYNPELRNTFQMHYFLADKSIVTTKNNQNILINQIIDKNYLKNNYKDKYLIPIHPWQAMHILQLPVIQNMLENGSLKDLGLQGIHVKASSSVRTVFADSSSYMLKLSLNISITNSMRMQYARELDRAIAADNFWKTNIGLHFSNKYPKFTPITDPAYLILHEDGNLIEETAVLFRHNPFIGKNNITNIAAICHDNHIDDTNRFNVIIPNLAKKLQTDTKSSALLWFKNFIDITIEPLLWLYTHHGIALEAHQQNLLISLDKDGLPNHAYYRDSQGYYISYEQSSILNQHSEIWEHFALGSNEFIDHHFTYYLICNTLFGVINALGVSGYISEDILILEFQKFIKNKKQEWPQTINNYLDYLLSTDSLPLKDNLQTRLYDLDELTAPLDQQSVYIDIKNVFKDK